MTQKTKLDQNNTETLPATIHHWHLGSHLILEFPMELRAAMLYLFPYACASHADLVKVLTPFRSG